MELMRHKTPAMTMRYSHLSVKYKGIDELPSFKAEMDSQQISQHVDETKAVKFGK